MLRPASSCVWLAKKYPLKDGLKCPRQPGIIIPTGDRVCPNGYAGCSTLEHPSFKGHRSGKYPHWQTEAVVALCQAKSVLISNIYIQYMMTSLPLVIYYIRLIIINKNTNKYSGCRTSQLFLSKNPNSAIFLRDDKDRNKEKLIIR